MKKFRGALTKICGGVSYVSMFALLFAMAVTVIDIVMKLTISKRVLGNIELVELSMVVMMFLCFSKTQLENGHVRVDLFINKFPPKVRCIVNGCIQCIVALFSIFMLIQSFKQISVVSAAGTSSQVLHIPYPPFYVLLSIGFALFTLTLILSALEYFAETPHAQKIEQ